MSLKLIAFGTLCQKGLFFVLGILESSAPYIPFAIVNFCLTNLRLLGDWGSGVRFLGQLNVLGSKFRTYGPRRSRTEFIPNCVILCAFYWYLGPALASAGGGLLTVPFNGGIKSTQPRSVTSVTATNQNPRSVTATNQNRVFTPLPAQRV